MTRSRRQRRWDVTNDVAPSIYFGLNRKLCSNYTLEFENGERVLEQTGADSHTLAAGNSHGLYSSTILPKLQLEKLETIEPRVEPPLVLHGGSAQPGSEIAGAVERGIN